MALVMLTRALVAVPSSGPLGPDLPLSLDPTHGHLIRALTSSRVSPLCLLSHTTDRGKCDTLFLQEEPTATPLLATIAQQRTSPSRSDHFYASNLTVDLNAVDMAQPNCTGAMQIQHVQPPSTFGWAIAASVIFGLAVVWAVLDFCVYPTWRLSVLFEGLDRKREPPAMGSTDSAFSSAGDAEGARRGAKGAAEGGGFPGRLPGRPESRTRGSDDGATTPPEQPTGESDATEPAQPTADPQRWYIYSLERMASALMNSPY